ncbi:ABC transporter permease [Pediococcus acidilactici]
MNELWQRRAKAYQNEILKYLKYVLNDHLVLALLFFGGGLGLAYADWLKTLQPLPSYGLCLVVVVTFLLTLFGQPVLLLKTPDPVFLLGQEKNIASYLKKSLRRTLISTLVPVGIGSIILFPLLALAFHQLVWVLTVILTAVLGSFVNILTRYQGYYFVGSRLGRRITLVIDAIIVSLVTVHPLIAIALMVIWLLLEWRRLGWLMKNGRFDWQSAVEAEQKRTGRLYRFFSLFTTVKNLPVKAKRRRYADGVVKFLAGKSSMFSYLYSIMIVRSGDRGSLMLRLLFLGMLVSAYSDQMWLKLMVGALTTYLIVIQLVDVYRPVQANTMVQVYPVDAEMAQKGLLSVLKRIILLSAILVTLAGCATNFTIAFLGWTVVVQSATTLWLTRWLVPRYIKKINK